MGMNDREQDAAEERKANRAMKAGAVADWRGYVNVDLSNAQKREHDDWAQTGEAWEVLDDVLATGCVLSLKTNPGAGGYLASLTQRNPTSVNAGLCVTARARTAGVALTRVLYIVQFLGVHNDWAASHPPADPDRW